MYHFKNKIARSSVFQNCFVKYSIDPRSLPSLCLRLSALSIFPCLHLLTSAVYCGVFPPFFGTFPPASQYLGCLRQYYHRSIQRQNVPELTVTRNHLYLEFSFSNNYGHINCIKNIDEPQNSRQ